MCRKHSFIKKCLTCIRLKVPNDKKMMAESEVLCTGQGKSRSGNLIFLGQGGGGAKMYNIQSINCYNAVAGRVL